MVHPSAPGVRSAPTGNLTCMIHPGIPHPRKSGTRSVGVDLGRPDVSTQKTTQVYTGHNPPSPAA